MISNAFRFIGGPKDGEYLALQDAPSQYVFPISPFSATVWTLSMHASAYAQVGRAVYLRHKLAVNPSNGQPLQEYTVYVYSHVEGLVPTDPGQKVLFESRTWFIDSISWMPMGARFQARSRESSSRAYISGAVDALYYKWDVDAWAFKSKSVVEVDETRTVVVR